MENTNNLEQKQQYLREEILDKSYDPEEFSDFMSKYKENGLDLNNWELIELQEAVRTFKNKVNEDEGKKIEEGVEKIRQSYRLDESKNQEEQLDEFLEINIKSVNKDNNCVNNILNDYLKNKENEKNKINKDVKKEYVNLGKNNDNQNLNENNKSNNDNQNNNIINSNNTNKVNDETANNNCNINKLKSTQNKNFISPENTQSNNINNINNNLINNNLNHQNNIINNIPNNRPNNIPNNININNNTNNIFRAKNDQQEFEDFEILEKANINHKPLEIIKCIKQSENSLTSKDNLNVDLSM